MRAQVTAANLMTSGSLAAAFVALLLASEGHLIGGLIAVAVAAVLDSIDGPLARRTSPDGGFGGQLDTVADHAAFGLAPAFMLYQGTLDAVPVAGFGACLIFVLAGAWRLARFASDEDDRGSFVGLPLPPAGLVVAAAGAFTLAPGLALVLALVISVTMISVVPFPTFLGIRKLVRPRRGRLSPVPPRGDHRLHRGPTGQRARPRRDDGHRQPEGREDERVGAPALARE
ncbi:MAG TPA: CDP-alcohol phosphatidyltransferase family protein [Solirubrobacteraceae bacterium]|nr:CDP-alcohol phosphatidyltransferase family protein [Solirubrobacteraceae bacterium]